MTEAPSAAQIPSPSASRFSPAKKEGGDAAAAAVEEVGGGGGGGSGSGSRRTAGDELCGFAVSGAGCAELHDDNLKKIYSMDFAPAAVGGKATSVH